MSQREIALRYAEKGIRVFPCSVANKRPLVESGHNDASTDPKVISAWWKRNPRALVAAPNDQFLVIDVDVKKQTPFVQALNEQAHDTLISRGIVDNTMTVRTKSGGYHYYFKKCEGVQRHIKVLPDIDLLGVGGYSILPDQSTYHANTDAPWDMITNLPDFNEEAFYGLVHDMAPAMDMYREALRQEKMKKVDLKKIKVNKIDLKSQDMPKTWKSKVEHDQGFSSSRLNNAMFYRRKEGEEVEHRIDYETGTITLEQTENMYKRSDKVIPEVEVKFNKDGTLVVPKGGMDGDFINAVFHTPSVQKRLGALVGLKVPDVGKKHLQRSVLPTHNDEHSSMGVRWSEDGTHILARDFANHFGDDYNQVDYNVVRLYASAQYNAQAGRLNPPEFVVWFIRMLDEVGYIDAKSLMKSYKKPYTECDHASSKNTVVANSFLYLDAVKSFYHKFNGESVFADAFSMAWSGVRTGIKEAKIWMVDQGLVDVVGYYDCRKKIVEDKEGMYATRVFVIGGTERYKEEPQEEKIETVEDQPIEAIEPQTGESEMSVYDASGVPSAEEMNENLFDVTPSSTFRMPQVMRNVDEDTIINSTELMISQESYDQIVNFCKDKKIGNVPDRKNMVFSVGAGLAPSFALKPEEKTGLSIPSVVWQMAIIENADGDANILALILEEDEPLGSTFFKYAMQYDKIVDDEPMWCIPISYNVDLEESDVTPMFTNEFGRYTGTGGSIGMPLITFSELRSRYMTYGQFTRRVMDGDPEDLE